MDGFLFKNAQERLTLTFHVEICEIENGSHRIFSGDTRLSISLCRMQINHTFYRSVWDW
jgi:hypothetical protein